MAKDLKAGDKVSWKSSGGKAEGVVVRKQTKRMTIKGHTVAASPEHPQYLVETDEGKRAAHKADSLSRR